MDENRHRHTVWMDDDVWDQVESHYQKDNCSTKNEYIEKAIQFYSGYLNSERAGDYLPRVLADVLEGSRTKLLDTRKTTPNMRVFEKYAVKVGGGYNHRYNLSDGILLKDNHIGAAGSVKKAVAMAKEYASFVRKIEVEVENLEMLEEALEAGADIIMLDNMDNETMRRAVAMVDGRAETECSGNVTLERLAEIAKIGVDYVSCGALTHSAPILDFSLKNLRPVRA